ncbi:substrate-binding periplasmic protein [Aestuariispira insulae]|uniref:substrate-binding periplasmic protein n=1 Tax=Aestuariispira insulae TaxID=1461337 RepID=UPI0015F268FD|nr:transporter substrate-binding domain-containing protein [Aestuariispira insulae]
MKAEPLRLTTGDDFPPYTGAELPEGGLASAIVIAAFAWMNQEVALEYRPWKRGYEETKAGQYLATYPYVKSRDRLVDFHFSDPIFQYERILFERRHPNASQWPDTLRGERLCLPVGYEVPSVIEDRVIKGTLILIKPSDMDACFKQLLRNRTDYVLSDRILGQSIASHHFGAAPQQLTMIEPPVSKQSAHLIIAKNQPDAIKIIADFNRALIALRADGTLDHLVALPSEQSSKPVSK